MGTSVAIKVRFISLVVRVDALESKYEGGFAKFLEDNPGMVHDGHLVRFLSMNPWDSQSNIDWFADLGLTPMEKRDGMDVWKDMCVVESIGGKTARCDWLDGNRRERAVFLRGTEFGEVVG
jgi:hypothetical protein